MPAHNDEVCSRLNSAWTHNC